jgi:hypothetical protein
MKPITAGTVNSTSGDTTSPGSRIQLNMFPRTRRPRMMKLPKNENSVCKGMLAGVSAEPPRNVVAS